jgi:hypothetical protein
LPGRCPRPPTGSASRVVDVEVSSVVGEQLVETLVQQRMVEHDRTWVEVSPVATRVMTQ